MKWKPVSTYFLRYNLGFATFFLKDKDWNLYSLWINLNLVVHISQITGIFTTLKKKKQTTFNWEIHHSSSVDNTE